MIALYAQRGERVTCENGHPICVVAQDIPLGAMHEDGFFCDWLQPEPKRGMLAKLCPCLVCGAPWFANGKQAIADDGIAALLVQNPQLHFEDGWR